MSEAAIAAPPANLARGASGPNWHWLVPAAEMAAEVSDAWPLGAGPAAVTCGGYPRIATRTAGCGDGSVACARDFTGAILRRWDIGARSDDIVVVVSELITNALRHARQAAAWPQRPVRLGLIHPGPCVLCAVSDPSDQLPAPREPDWLDETGRGLHVVSALSDDWGCTAPNRLGKVVWATFATGSGG